MSEITTLGARPARAHQNNMARRAASLLRRHCRRRLFWRQMLAGSLRDRAAADPKPNHLT